MLAKNEFYISLLKCLEEENNIIYYSLFIFVINISCRFTIRLIQMFHLSLDGCVVKLLEELGALAGAGGQGGVGPLGHRVKTQDGS